MDMNLRLGCHQFFLWLQDGILPLRCLSCRLPSERAYALCADCAARLPWVGDNCCQYCALPLLHAYDKVCGPCSHKPPPYDHLIAAFYYQKPIRDWLLALKFHGDLPYARLFGKLLAAKLEKNGTNCQAILPVPLHRQRLLQRGFNQAVEIARPIAKALQLPLLDDVAVRYRYTTPQSSLKRPARHRQRLRHAFYLKPLPHYQHIAIVDDTLTTGHTVAALCHLLRERGTQTISIWCAARTLPHNDLAFDRLNVKIQGEAEPG